MRRLLYLSLGTGIKSEASDSPTTTELEEHSSSDLSRFIEGEVSFTRGFRHYLEAGEVRAKIDRDIQYLEALEAQNLWESAKSLKSPGPIPGVLAFDYVTPPRGTTHLRHIVGEPLAEGKCLQIDYASEARNARIAYRSSEISHANALLKNGDPYMVAPCSANSTIVVAFSDFLSVERIELQSLEFFARKFRYIKVSGSTEYPTKNWTPLAYLESQPDLDRESFLLPSCVPNNNCWVNYLEFQFSTPKSAENSICALSNLMVYGSTSHSVFETIVTGVRESDKRESIVSIFDRLEVERKNILSRPVAQKEKFNASKETLLKAWGEKYGQRPRRPVCPPYAEGHPTEPLIPDPASETGPVPEKTEMELGDLTDIAKSEGELTGKLPPLLQMMKILKEFDERITSLQEKSLRTDQFNVSDMIDAQETNSQLFSDILVEQEFLNESVQECARLVNTTSLSVEDLMEKLKRESGWVTLVERGLIWLLALVGMVQLFRQVFIPKPTKIKLV